jgi:flavin reductase (DIM6/NTAB) family NADH-FMN oxidoreductase RutF
MLIDVTSISGRERYELTTSLIVPRPIGWLSTYSAAGGPNLAPFSYFAALSATPMLVGASIGSRRGLPKDTLANIRESGAFCVNVVTEAQLEAMNTTSGEYGAAVNEFEVARLAAARAQRVHAPYVEDCPAVLECSLFKEVELEGSSNTLVIGEVLLVRLREDVAFVTGTHYVDAARLHPVGRLWADRYALLGEVRALPRPQVPGSGRPREGG